MRLHRLELQAFGPYAAPQHIDFDRLTGSGLFLLEGPTGAGKTTILDAITFALYGGLAGQDAADDRLHSDFADPDIEPLVRLEFSVGGVRYQVTRVPEHQRRKRRGSGFTTEAMRVHLRRFTDGHWVSLSSNKAEAGEVITTAVGLNRAQFTQVMLLPQGEFARFLRADDDARRVLLTKLFGTGLYDQVTAELDRRRAEAVRARQQADGDVAVAVSAAAEAAGLDADARARLVLAPAAERALAFKQLADEVAALAEIGASAVELAAAEAERAAAAEQEAARQAALMTRLALALDLLGRHEATLAEHEQRVMALDAARRAEPVRSLIAALADADGAVGVARRTLRRVAGAGDLGGTAPSPYGSGLAGLVAGSSDSGLARKLSTRSAASAAGARVEAAALEKLADAEAGVPARETVVADLSRAAAEAEDLVRSLEAERKELPERLVAAEASLGEARLVAAGLEAARQRQEELGRIGAAARRLAEIELELERQGTVLRAAVDAHQELTDVHQRAMDARLAGMAAELAAGLAGGSPCPVCGSDQHPSPARSDAEQMTADLVAAARGRRDAAATEREAAQRRYDELDHEVAGLVAVAGGRSPDEISAEAAAAGRVVASGERALAETERISQELAGLRAAGDRLNERLVAAVAAEAGVRAQAEQAVAGLGELRSALREAAGSYPSVTARKRALEESVRVDQALAAALGELAAALDAAERARVRAESEAVASGFAGVAAAEDMLPLDVGGERALSLATASVRSPAEQAVLDEQVTTWSRKLAALRATVQAPEFAGLSADEAASATERAKAAVAALERARATEQEARSARDAHVAKAARLRTRLAEVEAAQDRAEALVAETGPVIYLAGLAKGMDGHRRVALTTYVLRHWFGQVVAAANVRLAVMSSGRYELRRSDEAPSRRQRAGLTLTVIDRYTGEERSPASLSGGETFYTSLALALGLADVVKAEAGGVDLQTLFIDEGFGSLDDDTLDQVLEVIDELRDSGRAVGIVSHVAELKQRVPERLEVRRLADGSSAARVVA
jgi:exonuclease SbcC